MTLSKQICELCGISARNDENAYFTGHLGEYPNLENPKNFVKLLNLLYRCGINHDYDYQLATMSFEEDNLYHENIETFEQLHLMCLLSMLQKEYDSWDKQFKILIKDKIKNADWEY